MFSRIIIAQAPGPSSGVGSRWPFHLERPGQGGYMPYPFRLGYASALLKEKLPQAKVWAYDPVAQGDDAERFLERVHGFEPDLLILEFPTLLYEHTRQLTRRIKENDSHVSMALAGAHATAMPEVTRAAMPWIDWILVGEYEEKAVTLASQARVDMLPVLIEDLDCLPFPDRDDLNPLLYHDFSIYEPNIQVWTSRGCFGSCIFCVERHVFYGSPRIRTRNPRKVVDEMDFCVERFAARQFYFDDMSFTARKSHVWSICDEMIARGGNYRWTCMGDAVVIDYDTLKKMRGAGCLGMKFGVECADPEILRSIGKPVRLEKVRKVVKWLRDLGIRSHATYMFGLPGEKKETMRETLNFALELDTDSAQFAIATPFPGTPFYKMCEEQGYLTTHDWDEFDGTCRAVISYPGLSVKEIESFKNEAERMWRRSKSRRGVIRALTHPGYALRKIRELGLRDSLSVFRRSI